MKRTLSLALLVVLTIAVPSPAASPAPDDHGDVVRFLPSDLLGYLAVTGIQDWATKSCKLAERVFGEDEGKKMVKTVRESIRDGLAKFPLGMRKDVETAIDKIANLHFGLVDVRDKRLVAALLIEAADKEILTTLFGYLRAATGERSEYERTTILRVATGDTETVPHLFIAMLDGTGVVTSDLDLMKEIVRRQRKIETSRSFADNPGYRAVAKPAAISCFADIRRIVALATCESGRAERLQFDMVDAVLGIRKIRDFTGTASLTDDGEMVCEGALNFAPGCAAWEIARQKAAAKDCLACIPADAMLCYAYTINDPTETWKNIRRLISENEEAFGAEQFVENLRQFEKNELGFSLAEILRSAGDEAAFYVGNFDIMGMMGGAGNAPPMAFIIEGKSAEAAAAAWKSIRRRFADKLEEEIHKGVVIEQTKGESGMGFSAYAVVDRFLLIGTPVGVKKVIDARKDGGSLAENAGFNALMKRLPGENVAFMTINMKKYYQLIEKILPMIRGMPAGFALPSSKSMPDDLYDVTVTVDRENAMTFSSRGSGATALIIPSIAMEAYFVTRALRKVALSGPIGVLQKESVPFFADPPTLPDDPAAAKRAVADLIGDLGDDEPMKRIEATKKLQYLGSQPDRRNVVLPLVREALASEDAEVRSRAKEVLTVCNDFGAMPDVVKARVAAIVAALGKRAIDHDGDWDFADERPRGMEPYLNRWNQYPLKPADMAVLKCDEGIVELARALEDDKTPAHARISITRILSCHDSRAAGEILARLAKSEEIHSAKVNLIVALGWSDRLEAKKIVEEALAGGNLGKRRAAFLAVERSSDPAWIDKLIDLLESADDETRFNAGYTLERLSGGKSGVTFNAFEERESRAKSVEAIKGWWKGARETHKAGHRDYTKEIPLGGSIDGDIERVMIGEPVPMPPPDVVPAPRPADDEDDEKEDNEEE